MSAELHEMGILEACRALRTGEVTSAGLVEALLERIDRVDAAVGAFVVLDRERARVEAAMADARLRAGENAPLLGVPLAVKDIFDVAGLPTRANSNSRDGSAAPADSACVAALRRDGAIVLGKLATHELAATAGPPAELPFPPARNPWDLDRDPGGSSSGSAAAVSARLISGSVASDTGGSIRQPSAFCGVVGMKPSFGRVSRFGCVPMTPSLDHVGPIARSVADCGVLLASISGFDARDLSSMVDAGIGGVPAAPRPFPGCRVGVLREFHEHEASPDVLSMISGVVSTLRGLGCEVGEAVLPLTDDFVACGRMISLAEFYSMHGPIFREAPGRFGRWTRNRMEAGALLSADDYITAQRRRQTLAAAVDDAFRQWDFMITAGARTEAPPLTLDGPDLYWQTRTDVAFNVTGHPVLSLPVTLSASGLPLGVQIAAPFMHDVALLSIGLGLEEAVQFRARPQLG